MLPFRVVSAVMCDEVRQEGNGKGFLIGVYGGLVLVPGFPSEFVGSWWLQVAPQEIGQFETDIRVVKEDSATLVRAVAAFQILRLDPSAIVVPKTPLHLQSPGHLKLQMKLKNDADWTTVSEFEVRLGSGGGVQQVTPQQRTT